MADIHSNPAMTSLVRSILAERGELQVLYAPDARAMSAKGLAITKSEEIDILTALVVSWVDNHPDDPIAIDITRGNIMPMTIVAAVLKALMWSTTNFLEALPKA